MEEAKQKVRENRIAQLELQIADALLNIAIYKAVCEKFQREEDRQVLAAEQEKLIRFETAMEVVRGGDW